MRQWLGGILAWCLVASCGGGMTSGGSGGSATQADVSEVCAAICDRDARCGNPDPTCEADCVAEVSHPESYRADFLDAYTRCIQALDCAGSDDSCMTAAANEVSPSWQNDPLFQSCNAKRDECQSFSDDRCAGAIYFSAAGRQKLESCLSLACEQIGDCLGSLE